jgi:hypothetical protein
MFEKNYAVNRTPAIVFADRTEVKATTQTKVTGLMTYMKGTKSMLKRRL